MVPVSLPRRSIKERGVRWGGGSPQAGVGAGAEPGQRGTGEVWASGAQVVSLADRVFLGILKR